MVRGLRNQNNKVVTNTALVPDHRVAAGSSATRSGSELAGMAFMRPADIEAA